MAVTKLYRLQSLNGFRYLIGKALLELSRGMLKKKERRCSP